jgi:hypothetical protein
MAPAIEAWPLHRFAAPPKVGFGLTGVIGLKWSHRALGAAGFALAAMAVFLLTPKVALNLGPIDLAPGAVRTAAFKVGYSGLYTFGVQMDQAAAKRLAPCLADSDWFPSNLTGCQRPTPHSRPALSFTLAADGKDLTRTVIFTDSGAGGQYGGRETFTWLAASAQLQPGRHYELVVHSLGDGSALAEAHPKLIAEMLAPRFGVTVQQTALVYFGWLLVLGAVALLADGGISALRKPKQPAPSR